MKSLVVYTGSGCKPCALLKATLLEMKPDINITFKNVEEFSNEACARGVLGLPTVVLVDENQCEIARHVGNMTKTQVEELIAKAR